MTVLADHRTLLRSRRADPARVGAIAPTGRRAARALARSVPPSGVALELGAGTGAITRVLRSRARQVIAVESDPALAAHVPGAVLADARDLEHVLDDAGVHRVDAVVSSLPLTLMAPGTRRAILAAAARRLVPGGSFTTITYRPAWSSASRAVAGDLSAVFDGVTGTGPIWANLPPARLVHAHGPRPC